MLKLFVGLDTKEQVGFHVFVQSVISRTDPNQVEIIPICRAKGSASNTFNMHWPEIPRRCGFKGRAVFVDGSDMLCRSDILELPDLLEPGCDVALVPHCYSTKFPTKFLGQPNEDYPRKNWASVLVLNCDYSVWRTLDEKAKGKPASYLQRFEFLKDDRIGLLPKEWNWLVGEYPYNPEAKIAHFTIGLPCWPAYRHCDYADEWRDELKRVNYYQAWGSEPCDDTVMASER